MTNFICCGSKKYNFLNFDELVDSFDIIIRHGHLLPNNGYGKRNADIQVLNSHEYKSWVEGDDLPKLVNKYCKDFGIPEGHFAKWCEYSNNKDTKFLHYPANNVGTLRKVLKDFHIDHDYLRVGGYNKNGLSSVVDLISRGVKPFLIGYSIQESDIKKHVYNSNAEQKINGHHTDYLDCTVIIKLHEAELIDATLCCLDDTPESLSMNNLLKPTEESINLLSKIKRT